jgi:hypothetical protein
MNQDSSNHRLSNVQWVDAKIPKISATEIRCSSLEEIRQNDWLHPNAFKIWKQFVNKTP